MSNISQYLQEGVNIDYTPVTAVYAGNILQVGALSAFAGRDIGAAELGAVAVSGVIRGPYIGGIVCNIGDNVWWDANGTPYGGAANGAFTCNAAAGDWWAGTLVRATTATGATADIALNKVNPSLPAWQGKTHFTTAIDISPLVAATHSGGVIHVTKDAHTDTKITMPAGVAGMEWIVQNDDADAANGMWLLPNGAEIIEGANLTLAAGDAKNTLATSIRGDYLHVVCNVSATSWRCVAKRGIWLVE